MAESAQWTVGNPGNSVSVINTTDNTVIGPMAIAYLAFTAALTDLRASTVATLALVEPVIATALAVLVVGEVLGALSVVGIALVSVSLLVFSLNRGPELRA